MNWFTIITISIVFFSIANALAKYYQPKIAPLLSMIYLAAGALIVTLLVYGLSRFIFNSKDFHFTKEGAIYALIGGGIWALAQLLFFFGLRNAPLSIVGTYLIGGIGIGGVLAGVLLFKEPLTIVRLIGVIVILIGSIILSRS